MSSASIRFEEISTNTNEILHQMSLPGLKKNFHLPPQTAMDLRRHQIARLEENIQVLRQKQAEFHRKMEDYIASLRNLINNLRRGLDNPASQKAPAPAPGIGAAVGTYVRCVGCGAEKDFPDVNVLYAKEPEDFLAHPTEVIVQHQGQLKKGIFRCPNCGDCNITIRPKN
ncbi:MAG: hypothetical protein HY717_06505 [Planctomycetes bacterium]|nr:hypothetical protein [Planctomycetota bacterium]